MSSIRRTSVFALATLMLIGCTTEGTDTLPGTSTSSAALSGADGNAYVNFHRDRLLTGYAADHGVGSAANAWATFTYTQKLLFLVHTDLLGNRSFMVPTANYYYRDSTDVCGNVGDLCGECEIIGGQRACSGCTMVSAENANACDYVSAYDCYTRGGCDEQVGVRSDWSMALEHVTKLYEVLDNGSCSGDDGNRSFFSADADLIGSFRNRYLTAWTGNSDLGSVHSPFNNRTETINGRPFSCDGPDGQIQMYSYDYQGVAFTRGGKYLPADGRMFELDDDYDTTHESNPTCYYCGGQYGLSMYESHWRYQGNAQPFDWGYAPGATAPQIAGEQLAGDPYTSGVATPGAYISIWGTNLCASPEVLLGGTSQSAYLAGPNQINAFVTPGTAAGGQSAYVICAGVWSNAWPVSVQ